jgi:signal transduction histidine kinase
VSAGPSGTVEPLDDANRPHEKGNQDAMGRQRKDRSGARVRHLLRRVAAILAASVICALVTLFPAPAHASVPVAYGGSAHVVEATNLLRMRIVPGPERAIDDVLADDARFVPLSAVGGTRPVSLGDDTTWLQGAVANRTAERQRLFFVHDSALVDHVRFYERKAAGWQRTDAGDHVPVAKRPMFTPSSVFPIDLEPGETRAFVIEMRTTSAVMLGFQVVDATGLLMVTLERVAPVIALFGFLLALALYNLNLFLGTRDKLFLAYAGSVSGEGVTWLTTSGTLGLLFPDGTVPDGLVNCLPALSIACSIAFARGYVELPARFPKRDRFLAVVQNALVAWALVVPFFFRRLDVAVTSPAIGVVFVGLIGVVGSTLVREGNFYARNYALAMSCLAGGSIAYILAIRGVLPHSSLVLQAPYVGGALNAFILSAGLGERVRRLREEADRNRELALSAARNQLEEQEKVTREIQRLDQLKDLFLATTSHELRTPINGMVGLADALLDGYAGPLPARAEKNLRIIVESGRRLANLVNDILDYTRLRHAELVIEKHRSALRKCVDAVVDLQRPEALRKGLALTVDVPTSMVVVADDGRVQQILHNLVGNAIKFTSDGFVAVSAREEGGRVVVEVQDSGPGIPVDVRGRLFQPFEQGSADAKVARRGTGLGLAIARQLAEAHGGTMRIEDRPGGGSIFRFDLEHSPNEGSAPVVSVLPPPLSEEAPPSLAAVSRVADPHNETVLIVDDDAVNRHVLVQQLTRAGISVEECENGTQAVERILSENCPALVLLDVMMPDLSGFDVLDRVRPHRNSTELPVVVLTALSREHDIVDGFRHGANDYLTKPFTREELLVRIGHHMSLRRYAMQSAEARRRLERELEERRKLEGDVEQLRERQTLAQGDLEAVLRAKATLETEREEAQKQLIQAEKMASLGQMVASVAHEIDNPLNYVNGAVAVCQRRLATIRAAVGEAGAAGPLGAAAGPMNDVERFLGIIDDGVRRLAEVTRAMRNYGRLDDVRTDHVSLETVIQEALVILGARTRPYDLRTEFGGVPGIRCHRSHIGQVVLNLVANATDALATIDRGTSTNQGIIRVRTGLSDDGRVAWISIEDDGPGVPEEAAERIFKPFYTTKPAGKGTGLGLPICKRIAEEHGGDLVLDRSPELGGARFTLTLPAPPPSPFEA